MTGSIRKGDGACCFGYFLPGVRHLTAFAAGTSRISFPEFVFFTSAGAFVWTAVFMTLGFVLEEEWSRTTEHIQRILGYASLAVIVLGAVYLGLKKRSPRKA